MLIPVLSAAQDAPKVEAPILFGAHLMYYFPTASGASIMLQRPIREVWKQARSRKNIEAAKNRRDVISLAAQYYHYPQYQSGLSVLVAADRQYLNNNRFYSSLSAGIGLLRTFYAGSVYQVNADGNVKTLAGFGRFYGLCQVSNSVNWRLGEFLHSQPVLTIRAAWQFQFPYNSFIKPNFILETGLLFNVGRVKMKSIKKMKSRL